MTQNRNPRLPGIETALADHARQLRELSRGPGTPIYVGTYPGDPNTTPESPPFQNGHTNSSVPGFPQAHFYITKFRRVHVVGAFEGGTIGTVIFTLPVGYRPAFSERFACAGLTGVANYQVDPNGDVIQIF